MRLRERPTFPSEEAAARIRPYSCGPYASISSSETGCQVAYPLVHHEQFGPLTQATELKDWRSGEAKVKAWSHLPPLPL